MTCASDILQQVHSRTYHLIERAKREDPTLAIAQSSNDDVDLLMDFYREADTIIGGKLVRYNVQECLDAFYGSTGTDKSKVRKGSERYIPLLVQAISQYMVEYIVWRWFCHVLPGWQYDNYMELRLEEVDKFAGRIVPIPRRRATDLAGI